MEIEDAKKMFESMIIAMDFVKDDNSELAREVMTMIKDYIVELESENKKLKMKQIIETLPGGKQ